MTQKTKSPFAINWPLVDASPGLLRLGQTHKDMPNGMAWSDLLRLELTCSVLLRLAQTCSNLLKLVVRTGTILQIFLYLRQFRIHTYKLTTLGLLYPRWFLKFFFYKFTRIGEDWVFGWNFSLHQPLALAQWFFTTPLHSLAEHKTKSSQLPKLYHDLGCWKLCAKVHEKLGVT